MELVKRLEEKARRYDRQNYDDYSLAVEDLRALLTEAAERIRGLSLLVEGKRGRSDRR